ncbi:MAG: XdhC/CoxI family protein [Chloroflexota bacterium]
MRDVFVDIERWRERGERIAMATVVQTWGSAPRVAGSKMALTPDNEISGSVSGGCVEGAVYETGAEVIETGQPQLLHFGVADETAWEVGLACGGMIDVFVEPFDPALHEFWRGLLANEDRSAAIVTVIKGQPNLPGRKLTLSEDGKVSGELGGGLDESAAAAARTAMAEGSSRRVPLGEAEVFIEVISPAPTLVVVGGAHISIALTAIAKTLGYRTIVVDPRRAFGSEARFPHVDKLIQEWPDEALSQIKITSSTAVAMLTHDPKLDDPALKIVLPGPAFYVGALGSRTTQAKRRARLLAEGLTEAQLDRLHGPIGIDIGGRTPEEIALSVMAEIVAARNKQGR